ncbi:hypothetical protein ACN42_g7811 [Penicillium freii]|uniref:Uncharacterized protein n=1 Tax=Penicillium freii TaxID=48697 RepID=A0A101MEY2_PENFR|nr:hypothetical protein ACN42_g7811 [Penicillium freii]
MLELVVQGKYPFIPSIEYSFIIFISFSCVLCSINIYSYTYYYYYYYYYYVLVYSVVPPLLRKEKPLG